MAAAGYLGTPLAKKLSLKDGMTVWFHAMPESVRAEIGEVALEERARHAGLQSRTSLPPNAPN